MRKTVSIALITITFILVSAFIYNKSQPPEKLVEAPIQRNEKANINASFIIVTGNITRSFTVDKYHNLSSDVYIEKADPSIVYVTKTGITWDDFFKTLPMKLTKDCLITGDGETLCNGKGRTLKFYLNDIETPNLLDREIKDGDKALIQFF